ncbi:unnamed protein product [Spodoptera exigua]|nr:unnamed protein product [Spodoptera exigua]
MRVSRASLAEMKKIRSSASLGEHTRSSRDRKSTQRLACCVRTWSKYSGSEADASHRLFSMNIFGCDIFVDTLWKKFFSVTMSVDSALATSTKTSASRQYLSIHSSRLGVTSTPGLSTSTTSSRSSAQSSRGQYTCTSEHSCSRDAHSACPSWLTDCTLSFSSEPSVRKNASSLSEPSTCRKQLVVCPIPLGSILSCNIALITVLFPLLVRPKKATFM